MSGGINALAHTRGKVDANNALVVALDPSSPIEVTQVTTNTAGALIASGVALTDGAGAETGTVTNAPVAGNPTKWIPIDDNGTTRWIPTWPSP